MMEQTSELNGQLERVTFHHPDTGFAVLKVQVKGRRELVTVLGHGDRFVPGESLVAEGVWIQNRDYGLQFKANQLKTELPIDPAHLERYLASGAIKGVGPVYAKKLAEAFGKDLFSILDDTPERIAEVPGLGEKRSQKFIQAWQAHKAVRNIMLFLQSHGVSPARAVRIHRTYGNDAILRVKANPYDLAKDIHGIGFKTADHIAQNLGIDKNSPLRAAAGLRFAFLESLESGHTWVEVDALLEKARLLLEIERPLLEEALKENLQSASLIQCIKDGDTLISNPWIDRQERTLAETLTALAKEPVPWGDIKPLEAIGWAEKKLDMQLADQQREAILQALTNRVIIITGGPGTGKSTLTRVLTTILRALHLQIALCSPTGKAAKRLGECTGLEAKTIHRLLGRDPKGRGFLHNKEKRLVADVFVIDEASMLDLALASALVQALPPKACVIWIGDVDQLPSVGPGQVLADLIDSEILPTVRLNQIFRQAGHSQIVRSAHRVRQGKMPSLEPTPNADFFFIECQEPEQFQPLCQRLIQDRIPSKFQFQATDIQLLTPMQRSQVGARALNTFMQQLLNPKPAAAMERFGQRFQTGDRVMVVVNDYDKDVFNGDTGILDSIDFEAREVLLALDGRKIVFGFDEMDTLQLAYALTVHKSQGSEYPAVIIPVFTQHYTMLRKRLLYTAMTRGKKLVLLCGQKKALFMALNHKDQGKRLTRLSEHFCGQPWSA